MIQKTTTWTIKKIWINENKQQTMVAIILASHFLHYHFSTPTHGHHHYYHFSLFSSFSQRYHISYFSRKCAWYGSPIVINRRSKKSRKSLYKPFLRRFFLTPTYLISSSHLISSHLTSLRLKQMHPVTGISSKAMLSITKKILFQKKSDHQGFLELMDSLSWILSHLISSHLISSHLISQQRLKTDSSHLISSHLISSHLISSRSKGWKQIHPVTGITSKAMLSIFISLNYFPTPSRPLGKVPKMRVLLSTWTLSTFGWTV